MRYYEVLFECKRLLVLAVSWVCVGLLECVDMQVMKRPS